LGASNDENGFVSILKNKLHHPIPHARLALLRTLHILCSKYGSSAYFLRDNNLIKVVEFMAEKDSSMLVRNMAQQLLKEGSPSNKDILF
jgi:hypothetical protein